MHHECPAVQSCLIFLRALQVVADTKLIAEMLDVVANIKEGYCLDSCIEDATFCSLVMSIGCKHRWDILKSPLERLCFLSVHQVVSRSTENDDL